MSVQALNHVRKLRAGGFAQGVLLYLAMCHNGETGQCNPTRENIREFFSCDVKRVDRALSALKQAGLIVSIKKPSREGVSNWYVFPNLDGSPQNGIDPKTVGSPQNGERVAPKTGATGSPQNGEGKSNKKSKEKEVSASSSEAAPTTAKKVSKKEPTGTRFTLENLPDDWRAECRRIQPKADPSKVFEEFRDHWIAQPGAKGRKSDWLATWRNWCRRINARDLERVGYEAGRSQFIATPQNSGPQKENIFKVKPATLPQPKTPEQIEEERSYDLFCRVLDGKAEGDCDDPFA